MVKPKNVAYISIQFIPFLMQDYGADIVFIDELVGEV